MPDRIPDTPGLISRRALWGYVTALVVVGADQWTKSLATSLLEYRQPVMVNPWFDWMLTHNTGAAFSFLADAGGWQRWFFACVALAVSGVMVIWLSRLSGSKVWLGASLGLILGGGLGNLWDRLVQGYVVDFISVHYGDWYWPAFNIADSAITVGACFLVIDSFIEGRPAHSNDRTENDNV